MKRLSLLLILFTIVLSPRAKADFEFNANCIAAYKAIIALRLDQGRVLVAKEKRENPKNNATVLLENYIDFYQAFTSEKQSDLDRLKANKADRLKRLEKENTSSPYILFARATINMQSAIIRARFEEYYGAAMEINRAYSLLKENQKKYPTFWPNNKDLGVLNVVLGNLPSTFRSVLSTFGVSGDVQTGTKLMEQALSQFPASTYPFFYDETALYYSYLLADMGTDANAYSKAVRYLKPIGDESLLKSFVQGYVNMKTAHTDAAIILLSPKSWWKNCSPFKHLEYLLGVAKLNRRDDDADVILRKYLNNYQGVFNIKDTYLRLAWISLLNKRPDHYNDAIKKLSTQGFSFSDKDKHAQTEAGQGIPNSTLLNARLLYDGGYYDRALAALKPMNLQGVSESTLLEYNYRMGRIYDGLNNQTPAIAFYTETIKTGSNKPWYFAANASLNIARIYEAQRNQQQAAVYYRRCLSMKGHEYKSSIDAKAKAGLKRIEP